MAKKKSTNKSAETNAREASKRMGLEFGSEEMGANFAEGPNGRPEGPNSRGEGPKGPNANKKNNKNNR